MRLSCSTVLGLAHMLLSCSDEPSVASQDAGTRSGADTPGAVSAQQTDASPGNALAPSSTLDAATQAVGSTSGAGPAAAGSSGTSGSSGVSSRAGTGGVAGSASGDEDAAAPSMPAGEQPGELCDGTPTVDPSQASVGSCAAGSRCLVPTCAKQGVCQSEASGSCFCGFFFDDKCVAGAQCLCPSCGDDVGICLLPAERTALCAGPASGLFKCL
jgi:hypothetical protein